jgi:hypothetical protein
MTTARLRTAETSWTGMSSEMSRAGAPEEGPAAPRIQPRTAPPYTNRPEM